MGSPGKPLDQLLREVLDERAAEVAFTPAQTEAAVSRLRTRLDLARAQARVAAAIATLPAGRQAGWRDGAQAALRIVLGEARRSSRILGEAARGLMPQSSDAWSFGGLAAARGGEQDERRIDSEAGGLAPLSVTLDDSGAARRIIAVVRDAPADRPAPVLLIVPDTGGGATEVAAESTAEPGGSGRRLRYEATLPPGGYSVFLGNPDA